MALRSKFIARRQNNRAMTKSKTIIASGTNQIASKPHGVMTTWIPSTTKVTGNPTPMIRPGEHQTHGGVLQSLRLGDGIGRRRGHGSCMKPAILSAIMMVGALVLPPTRVGITEASTTRSPCRPRTRQRWSTTAIGSLSGPILQVPTGW